MTLGLFCKLANALYFKDKLELYFEFLPELVFINAIFGYLVLLIFRKWSLNFNERFVLNNDLLVHIHQDSWINGYPPVPSIVPPCSLNNLPPISSSNPTPSIIPPSPDHHLIISSSLSV
jgi:hypothetical protein